MEEQNEYRDRLKRLQDQAELPHPEPWIPEVVGDGIGGIVVEIKMLPTRFGDCPVVTLVNDAGLTKAVWLTHTVLRNEFHRLRVTEGEMVYVRYDGRKVGDDGEIAGYESYKVVVDRATSGRGFDWDASLGPIDRDATTLVEPADARLEPERPSDDDPAPLAGQTMPVLDPSTDDIPF